MRRAPVLVAAYSIQTTESGARLVHSGGRATHRVRIGGPATARATGCHCPTMDGAMLLLFPVAGARTRTVDVGGCMDDEPEAGPCCTSRCTVVLDRPALEDPPP